MYTQTCFSHVQLQDKANIHNLVSHFVMLTLLKSLQANGRLHPLVPYPEAQLEGTKLLCFMVTCMLTPSPLEHKMQERPVVSDNSGNVLFSCLPLSF